MAWAERLGPGSNQCPAYRQIWTWNAGADRPPRLWLWLSWSWLIALPLKEKNVHGQAEKHEEERNPRTGKKKSERTHASLAPESNRLDARLELDEIIYTMHRHEPPPRVSVLYPTSRRRLASSKKERCKSSYMSGLGGGKKLKKKCPQQGKKRKENVYKIEFEVKVALKEGVGGELAI
ncbi:hypothetical protein B0H14DRAFT_2620389 [Mycena olivaceomarginata]|nr:hypothetical protein B0H14DRAFT_2620389 [Mycena olivaceomarginata]